MLHSLKMAAGLFDCMKAWPNLGEGRRDLQGAVRYKFNIKYANK